MTSQSGIPKFVYWIIPSVAALAIVATVVINWAESSRSKLPVFGALTNLDLVERSGKPLTLADLKGRVHVVDFFFSNCKGACPIMSARMADLYHLYDDSSIVGFLSISVDPDRDSLEVLKRYALEHGVTDNRWLFARGEMDSLRELLEKGFMLAADELPAAHPTKLILVDEKVQIRGYYAYDDSMSIKMLKTHIRILARAIK